MVSVPTYQRSVADRPIHQQNLTTRATGEDFGAGIGRGLQQVAGGTDQAVASFQRFQGSGGAVLGRL